MLDDACSCFTSTVSQTNRKENVVAGREARDQPSEVPQNLCGFDEEPQASSFDDARLRTAFHPLSTSKAIVQRFAASSGGTTFLPMSNLQAER
jgi:hypothetical protein